MELLVPPRVRNFVPLGTREEPVSQAPVAAEVAPAPVTQPEPAPPALPPIDLDAERNAAYEAGRRAAFTEIKAELDRARAAVAMVEPMIAALATARRQAVDQAADEVIAIVIGLSRRVVGDALALHPEALPNLVRSALERLPREDRVELFVPPGAGALFSVEGRVTVVEDPTLSGGVVARTRDATVDASLDAVWSAVEEATRRWRESCST
jgi:flagellar assembly protein FliH